MRTLFLTLCIFSVTVTAKAQLFSKDWAKGCYYDTLGHKFTGLLFHAKPEASVFKGKGDHVFFKTSKGAEQQKISSDQIKSFIIETDSFKLTHVKALEKFPILQVMINHEIKLYFSSITPSAIPIAGAGAGLIGSAVAGAALSGKGSSAYYFGPDADHITTLVHKNYIEVLNRLMADKPEVVEKIKNKKFPSKSLPDLLEYYRTGVLPKQVIDDVY